MDSELRNLERLAKAGDEEAGKKLRRRRRIFLAGDRVVIACKENWELWPQLADQVNGKSGTIVETTCCVWCLVEFDIGFLTHLWVRDYELEYEENAN